MWARHALDLAAAAERQRHLGRHQPRGRIVVGDEHGVEAGPLVPPQVLLGGEPAHRGAPDVVRRVGVAVEIDRRGPPIDSRQLDHRPVGQESAGDERGQCDERGDERSDLAAKIEPPRPGDQAQDPPYDIDQRQPGQEAMEPAEAEHCHAVPQGVDRREHGVGRRGDEMEIDRDGDAGRIGERRGREDARRQQPEGQARGQEKVRLPRARDSPDPPSTRRGARG